MWQWVRNLRRSRLYRRRKEILDPEILPEHVAIVMDGNGRWAERRGLPRTAGHQAGVTALRRAVRGAVGCGIQVLTVFAFSTENWYRPREEVDFLLRLPRSFLETELPELQRQQVRVTFVGRLHELPQETLGVLMETRQATADNSGMLLSIAMNYGGRTEIIDAARKLGRQILNQDLRPGDISELLFSQSVYTANMKDPDLFIRTGGEKRLSNFLLWQMAYTEIHFTPVLWPDFDEGCLLEAVLDYQKRERRFGRIPGGET